MPPPHHTTPHHTTPHHTTRPLLFLRKQAVFNAVMPPELLEDMVRMIATHPLLHGDMIESSR